MSRPICGSIKHPLCCSLPSSVSRKKETGRATMEEQEFKRLLALFPVVRSRDFCADQDSSRQSTSSSMQDDTVEEWHDAWDNRDKNEQNNEGIDLNDPFWKKLKLAVERKVGGMEAEKFCRAFQQVHRKLVYEAMSVDAAKKYIHSSSVPED